MSMMQELRANAVVALSQHPGLGKMPRWWEAQCLSDWLVMLDLQIADPSGCWWDWNVPKTVVIFGSNILSYLDPSSSD